jgi:hypothetical protein
LLCFVLRFLVPPLYLLPTRPRKPSSPVRSSKRANSRNFRIVDRAIVWKYQNTHLNPDFLLTLLGFNLPPSRHRIDVSTTTAAVIRTHTRPIEHASQLIIKTLLKRPHSYATMHPRALLFTLSALLLTGSSRPLQLSTTH